MTSGKATGSKNPVDLFTIQEANAIVQQAFEAGYWRFIIQNMDYPEIELDPEGERIRCPGFIPFKELALEVIDDLAKKKDDIKRCRACEHYFDINREDGIFGDPQNFERFICQGCAESMSAKVFFEKHLLI